MGDEVSGSPITDMKFEDVSQVNFTKLYTPKMKSVYWRYFGFPSNENDEVITKQNVVCIRCHKVLTNHGNTTNLRAHLQHRHKELFRELCLENDIRVPPRKTPRNTNHTPINKRSVSSRRVKLEFINNRNHDSVSEDDIDEAAAAAAAMQADEDGASQTMLYETMVPLTYDDADNLVEEEERSYIIEPRELKFGTKRKSVAPPAAIHYTRSTVKAENNAIRTYGSTNITNLAEAMADIVIKDLRNVDTLYDVGISEFIRLAVGNSTTLPMPQKINTLINEMHASKFLEIGDFTRDYTAEKPFSLSFELWINVEQRRFLSIYHNYLNEDIHSVTSSLYSTIEYTDYVALDELLSDFNWPNCTLALVNYEEENDDILYAYLNEKNIPIVICYVTVINKCLRRVFELEEVNMLLGQVRDLIQRHAAEINFKVAELPAFNEHFPWTLYELLKFFAESISWAEDMDQLVIAARTVVDALSALVIAIDTLRGEDIPLCGMMSPITSKIMIKKLGFSEEDDDLTRNIKRTIADVLQTDVIGNDTLASAALLDPRFHRLTTIDNLDRCVRLLTQKYNKTFGDGAGSGGEPIEVAATTSVSTTPSVTIKSESGNKNTSSGSLAKKSKLELLFDVSEMPNPKRDSDSTVETDLKRYRNEVIVQLDESPFEWWNKMGHIYGTLRDLATLYQGVPGVVTLSFKKNLREQIYDFNKRYILTGGQIDAILFLHHHGN